MKTWMKSRTVRLRFALPLLATSVAAFWLTRPRMESVFDFIQDWGRLGPFGDFVGGLANPVVSAIALFWLVNGVKLQRRELEGADGAHKDQLRAAALTAMISSKTTDMESCLEQMRFMNTQMLQNPGSPIRSSEGKIFTLAEAAIWMANLRAAALESQEQRDAFIESLEELVKPAPRAP